MSNRLKEIYPSLQIFLDKAEKIPSHVYLFEDPITDNWMTIDKRELSSRELSLLSAIYTRIDLNTTSKTDDISKGWIHYLNGLQTSPLHEETDIRAIQLSFPAIEAPEADLIEAVETFFGNNMIVLSLSDFEAVLIDRKSEYVHTADDFSSFTAVLESDFFLKVKLYVGKFHKADETYPGKYQSERKLFSLGLSCLPKEHILTMEKTFPTLLLNAFSENMTQIIETEILLPIGQDEELLKTVRHFFENGFNGSVTAEKMNIHRNTLNYRLAKFHEITGISVRTLEGALVAYYASLFISK